MRTQIANAYHELVDLRYQLYNGLFLTLPLDAIQHTGAYLPLLQETCAEGLNRRESPYTIIRNFFETIKPDFDEREEIDFLFKVIQYVERQVVLIDALEDSAYNSIHRVTGPDSWKQLTEKTRTENVNDRLGDLLPDFGVRAVLTAHPTQFYQETVLAIISDLTEAIPANQTATVRDLLQQLGKTPFFRKQKPTPYDEALLLTTYLKEVFYPAIGDLLDEIGEAFPEAVQQNPELVQLGFWPGGDRDGNPFVTVEITRKVAAQLRFSILSCYYEDIQRLKRRLSFAGVYEKLTELENRFQEELSHAGAGRKVQLDYFNGMLADIETLLRDKHDSLFIEQVQSLRRKAAAFGFHFASLDIRQDSRVLARTIKAIIETHPRILPRDLADRSEDEQINLLMQVAGRVDHLRINDRQLRDTVESVGVIREIQQLNGERAVHRFIISNCRSPLDIARLYALFRICGWEEGPRTVDLVPLFETVEDLQGAAESMRRLYAHETYRRSLEHRGNRQTVMLGFSDGTKDGGYLMANWAIYTAKEAITSASREAGVHVVFFDGRGGPPARGGGNSHLFYAALGESVENSQIQITLQGQTISSHYGIREAAVHNLELLLTGGLRSKLFPDHTTELTAHQRELIEAMALIGFEAYQQFKNHPLFVPYLLERSTLKYYSMANIGSRPTKRGGDSEFRFEDLRAIPFVGAWSQLKQNVPGFYGVGTALKTMEEQGRLDEVKQLYQESTLFRAFIANSMQSMSKTNFTLTRYMAEDPRFGEFWKLIHSEFELSRAMVLEISGETELLADNPRSRLSIALREKIVLPLLVIQQYALIRIQQLEAEEQRDMLEFYEKMVMRSLFGNINASRNSV